MRTRFVFCLHLAVIPEPDIQCLRQIGIKVEGVELGHVNHEASASGVRHQHGASVFLVGMRGSGKSFVGDLAAKALSWTSLDADKYFEEKYQIGLRAFVHDKGWPAFREAEVATLKELIETKSQGHIISLGGEIGRAHV